MKHSILTRTSGKNLTFTELKDKLNEVRNARYDLIVPSEDLKVHMPAVITTPSIPEAITATGVEIGRAHGWLGLKRALFRVQRMML